MPKPTELVDMRLTSAERNRGMPGTMKADEYSYGLSIRLEDPELTKLDIKRLPQPGDEYEIIAKGKVSNVYESQSEGNKGERAISIQITHLALK